MYIVRKRERVILVKLEEWESVLGKYIIVSITDKRWVRKDTFEKEEWFSIWLLKVKRGYFIDKVGELGSY